MNIWIILGLAAQALFSMRFLVQWIASERKKESVVPVSFWYFSLIGGMMLLIYSIHRKDPVFIIGQSTGVFIYARNIFLVARKKDRPGTHQSPSAV